ncbi:Hypothetical predicted protein [Pelobates cultripes]|uniref:Uncharacterized protein n=1 Tax=Pelobates cultripes TaxID=61616 RepID=A0AAD1WKR8_PELCU|nr:Hypothetical predicted protein [Pelobates cultripes]
MALLTAGGSTKAYLTMTLSKLDCIFTAFWQKIEARQQRVLLTHSDTLNAPTPATHMHQPILFSKLQWHDDARRLGEIPGGMSGSRTSSASLRGQTPARLP